ncbi:hypothetical protein ACOKGD_10850 [Microbacterium phosphatis]|uniref:hypothetical protein n=1 Tax=Microbacterium phosphatis TaxID=3140248 RepID=UPI0031409A70
MQSTRRITDRPLFWYLASVLAVLVHAGARIVQEPRYFFWDDTQLGAFGQWYALGSRILDGSVTILSPGAWQGGNYLAEGQWGIWNPVVWLIALGTHAGLGATVFATAVKIVFLVLLCTGAYLLARSYGATPWWAAIAGFVASTSGQTMFMDAPSWVTGLQNLALFSLAWWALKRHVDDGRSPIPFFLFTYVLVTFGYVFGVIELAFLLLAWLVLALTRRQRPQALRVLVLGAYTALLAAFVFLPGLLTAPVTIRKTSSLTNDLYLGVDLGDLATSAIPTALSSVRGYWGDFPYTPIQYTSWLLPLLVLFPLVAWRRSLRSLAMPLIMLGLSLAIVLGPSVIGPLRYPVRMLPYAVLPFAVILAVMASRHLPERVSRPRVIAAVVLTALSGWFAWAEHPQSWSGIAIAVVLQAVAIVVAFLPLKALERWQRSAKVVAAFLLCASLVVLAPQIQRHPGPPLGNFNVPSSVADMKAVAEPMDHGIMLVGDGNWLRVHPEAYDEALLANLWYLTGKDASSVYTVLLFESLSSPLCIEIRGWTCTTALEPLFEEDPVSIADDMALNTVVVLKSPGFEDEPDVPAGWSVQSREYTWLLTRDEPMDRAGGIARTSPGVEASVVSRDDLGVTVHVDQVGDEGGQIVFSRLAWPGYTTTGARLGEPERGFLLTLDVGASDEGHDIRVEFRPPGWTLELGSAITAGVIALGWTVWFALGIRRRREKEPVAS